MEERLDEAFEFDDRLTVVGSKLEPGDAAPDFTLDWIHPDTGMRETVSLSESAGTVRLLNVVISLDTPVCQIETRTWDEMFADLPVDVTIYTITMDLPFAVERWTSESGITHKGLSAHRSEQFGRDYGVLIKEWRMFQRSIFVIDSDGRIAYTEYVANQLMEPNYQAAEEAVREVAR